MNIKTVKILAIAGFCTVLSLAPSVLQAHEEDSTAPPVFATGQKIEAPFSLVDQEGHKVTDKDYHENKIIFFGYTSCPDTCPLTLHKIAKAVESLGPQASKVQVLFITTDPERDNPATMKQYLSSFGPVKIVGLTGTSAQIKKVETEYGVYVEKRKDDAMTDYEVDHSAVIYLVGPDSTLLDMYGIDSSAEDVAKGIKEKI